MGPMRTLNDDQRRAFLYYYAPVILKRSSETASKVGRDWITNYNFDSDQVFSNNKANWEALPQWVSGGQHATWAIRPTLYTGFIEFVANGRRDAIMLFHVYHAKEENSIHDWERIEIRINGIVGNPGSGETVSHVIVTEHSTHNMRAYGNADLNFMDTPTGKHALLWQAQETEGQDLYRAEIHFVEHTWASVKGKSNARVDVNGAGKQNYHYLFVPSGDPAAVAEVGAAQLSQANAATLAAGTGVLLNTNQTKRIQYELQDLADILPTHWDGGAYAQHWKDPVIGIHIDDPVAGGLDGGPGVPTGYQVFHAGSIDSEDPNEDASGYPTKHWFWGAYEVHGSGFAGEAFATGAPAGGRAIANQDPASLNAYFRQHDYFAHDGIAQPGGPEQESGMWLPKGWNTPEGDGFDGRWEQLFPN
jgi:hypothetical protein